MSLAQTYRDFKRLKQIANVLFQQELGYFVKKLRLIPHLSFKKRKQNKKFLKPKDNTPKRLRMAMEDLGGSFVKLGQLLSLRPDLIPHEYVEEFSKLQDSVRPVPFDKIQKTIESEFHKPINQVFSHFNKRPIASASVGQVHKAVLKNGQKVAVKVQRPKIKEIFETDIDLMFHLAHLLEKYMPESKAFNPSGIVEEFEKYTKREMDYIIEAKNIDVYSDFIKKEKHIVVPKVYWSYTTSKVLTMEFIDGVKVSSVKDFRKLKVKRKFLSKTIVATFVKGVLYYRFFHADPHPGNILITKNKNIALLDFGITGFLTKELSDKIGSLYFAVIDGNLDDTTKLLIDLGALSKDIDLEKIKSDIRVSFRKYHGKSLEEIDMVGFFKDSLNLGRKYNFTFPVQYVLLLKAMITTEGVIHHIDPSFNFVEAGKPIFEEYIREKKSPENLLTNVKKTALDFKNIFINLPKDIQKIITKIEKEDVNEIDINDEDMDKLTFEMEKITKIVTLGMILAGLIIASALLMISEIPPFIQGIPLFGIIGLTLTVLTLLFLLISVKKRR